MNRPRGWRSEALNMAAAAVIALLVWMFANDRTRESEVLASTIRLAPPDPKAGFVEPSAALPVTVTVKGSRRAIDRAADALRAGITLVPGVGTIPAGAGTHSLDLADALGDASTLRDLGVLVETVRPASMQFTFGDLATVQVPVEPVLAGSVLDGSVAIDPEVVNITLPALARPADGALGVTANVDTANLEPGKAHQVDVELRLPESLAKWKELCRVVPPRAKVSFTLLANTSELTLDGIEVRVSLPAASSLRYEVKPAPESAVLSGIVVTGPRASIEALQSGTFVPAAVVDLADADVRPGRFEAAVTFWRLPEGVTVVGPRHRPIAVEAVLRER
ncbi:MAG: hypothetical protein RI990_1650 [Planctomycetota bacterium]|jgi:hypothetical protein